MQLSKIFISEPDPATCEIIAEVLTEEGYDVVVGDHGADLLQQIANHRPKLVMIDAWAGERTLGQLRAQFRMDPQLAVPLVGMTTNIELDRRRNVLHVDAWLVKPFTLTELIACVATVIDTGG